MAYSTSIARKLLENWYRQHVEKTGERQADIVAHLSRSSGGREAGRNNITHWFSPVSREKKPLPLNHAVRLREVYPDFPLDDCLAAYYDWKRKDIDDDKRGAEATSRLLKNS